jgi:hypothetical protein
MRAGAHLHISMIQPSTDVRNRVSDRISLMIPTRMPVKIIINQTTDCGTVQFFFRDQWYEQIVAWKRVVRKVASRIPFDILPCAFKVRPEPPPPPTWECPSKLPSPETSSFIVVAVYTYSNSPSFMVRDIPESRPHTGVEPKVTTVGPIYSPSNELSAANVVVATVKKQVLAAMTKTCFAHFRRRLKYTLIIPAQYFA